MIVELLLCSFGCCRSGCCVEIGGGRRGFCSQNLYMTNQTLVSCATALSLSCAAAEAPRVIAFTNRVESFTNAAGAADAKWYRCY